jgi:hypothetical protein
MEKLLRSPFSRCESWGGVEDELHALFLRPWREYNHPSGLSGESVLRRVLGLQESWVPENQTRVYWPREGLCRSGDRA